MPNTKEPVTDNLKNEYMQYANSSIGMQYAIRVNAMLEANTSLLKLISLTEGVKDAFSDNFNSDEVSAGMNLVATDIVRHLESQQNITNQEKILVIESNKWDLVKRAVGAAINYQNHVENSAQR